VKRFWIDNRSPNDRVVKRAFAWLDAATPAGKRAALLLDAKASLRSGDVARFVGRDAVVQLMAGRAIPLPAGGMLQAMAMHGHRHPPAFPGVVLIVYGDKKHLDYLDAMDEVTEVLVVPFTSNDVIFWVKQWGVPELGSPTPRTVQARSLPTDVVQRALRAILDFAGDHEGLRSKDKGLVVHAFQMLLDANEPFVADEVRAWLVTSAGEHPQLADDISELAGEVLSGRRFKGVPSFWKRDVVSVWRAGLRA
jgi:hypothetical protein